MPRTCRVVPTLAAPGMGEGYTYEVPAGMGIAPGMLVLVPLKGQVKKGVVVAVDEAAPEGVALRPVLAVYPGGPLMTPLQLELSNWLAHYYRSSLFAALKLCFWDLKFFQAAQAFRLDDPALAMRVVEDGGLPFHGDSAPLEELAGRVLGTKELPLLWEALDLHGTEGEANLPKLVAAGALQPDYALRATKRKAVEASYRAASEVDPETLTPKERELWRRLLGITPPWHYEVLRERLGKSRLPWNALVKKGVLEPIAYGPALGMGSEHTLTLRQQDALHGLLEAIAAQRMSVHLLQGITGSGKTEVYLRAAEAALEYGTVLFLVPEIALTHQAIARVTRYFGAAHVGVLHSAQTDRERRAVWEGVRSGDVRVLVGPRSALFAPAQQVSLIILDEEHEGAWKQHGAPRYHARTVAQKLAVLHGATVILGSATPALETYHAALKNEIGYHVLPERTAGAVLPKVDIVALPKGAMRGEDPTLTPPLVQLLEETLARGKQGLLFLNQRGFAKCLRCEECGDIPRCPRCEIALTVHSGSRKLVCHHCDFTRGVPRQCERCHQEMMATLGFGTQQVEQVVREKFPQASIARLDRDTTAQRGSMERILGRFASGDIDILVGTQMVAKGLDIPGLEAVGVILADMGLTLPDFRASERTFQLLTQVAGRAGRREVQGHVIVQTFQPDHPVIAMATRQDYVSFATAELKSRQQFYYPPYCRIVRVLFEALEERGATGAARDFAQTAHRLIGAAAAPLTHEQRLEVLGPAPAPLARLNRRYRHHVLLKVPRVSQGVALVEAWGRQTDKAVMKGTRVTVDVDPVDLL